MNIPKKSLAAIVGLVLVSGIALSLSGVHFAGDLVGTIPPWCIIDPASDSGSSSGGSYTPPTTTGVNGVPLRGYSWQMDKPGSMLPGSARKPDLRLKVYDPSKGIALKKFKDLDKPLDDQPGTSTSGSRGSSGKDTLRKGTPGVTVPGVILPGTPGGTSGTDTSGKDPNNGFPYWSSKVTCPDGYHVGYNLLDETCPRIKKALESGLFTEATLPDDMKKMLPGCKRWGSWFSMPKVSEADCDAFWLDFFANPDKQNDGETNMWNYCSKMYPSSAQSASGKLSDKCLEYKKNGGYLDPKVKQACEKQMWFWNKKTPSKDECKKLSSAMSDYKKAGGAYCDLPFSETFAYCSGAYPETMPIDFKVTYDSDGKAKCDA